MAASTRRRLLQADKRANDGGFLPAIPQRQAFALKKSWTGNTRQVVVVVVVVVVKSGQCSRAFLAKQGFFNSLQPAARRERRGKQASLTSNQVQTRRLREVKIV